MYEIKRRNPWLRTYAIGERTVNSIKFYRDGEVVADIGRGWLESRKLQDDGSLDPSEGADINFTISGAEPKVARKFSLDRKDHFLARSTGLFTRDKWDLYLHADEFEIEPLGERLALQTEVDANYLNTFRGRFVINGERQEVVFTESTYCRQQLTPLGARAEELAEKLSSILGKDISSSRAVKLLQSPELPQIIELLTAADNKPASRPKRAPRPS